MAHMGLNILHFKKKIDLPPYLSKGNITILVLPIACKIFAQFITYLPRGSAWIQF